MKILRNPEIKRELLVYAVLTAAVALIGFFIRPVIGALALAAGVLFCAAHLYFAHKRYREMEELAQKLNRILHGQDKVLIEESVEGELSILNSELHKMTLRLKEQADLLAADKVHLTEAIQDIFHQIRTPLTSMNLIVSMLREEQQPYERRLQMTQELKKQLERVQWLVESLLKLSKIDAGTAQFHIGAVSMTELVTKAADPLRIPMELREQTLRTQIAGEHVSCDLNWTTEALGNILKNCMEHTLPGGVICVTADENALYSELVVTDSGPGFSSEDLPHLFERFYKGQGSSEDSVGIGLALSRSILAAQNGTIKAENIPDGGARFTIRFYKSVV